MKTRIVGATVGLSISLAFIAHLLSWLVMFPEDPNYGEISAWGIFMLLQFSLGYWVWCSSESFLILRPYPLVVLFMLPAAIINAKPYFLPFVWAINILAAALSLVELYYSCKWTGILWLNRRKAAAHRRA